MKLTAFISIIIILVLITSCKSELEPVPNQAQPPTLIIRNENSQTQDLSARAEMLAYLKLRPDFKAEYKYTGVFNGQEQTGTQTIVSMGADFKQAVDTDALYIVDKEVYTCVKEDEWVCYHIPQEKPLEEQDPEIPDNVTVTKIPSVEGLLNANCFELTVEEDSSRVVNCFSDDGVLLYFLREGEGFTDKREATFVSSAISKSDFDLPSEPIELSLEDLESQP